MYVIESIVESTLLVSLDQLNDHFKNGRGNDGHEMIDHLQTLLSLV